jgi:hypothetical protein
MEDLRVPKRRVPAEVLLPGGGSRRIVLFLAEAAPGHAGPERPGDLLNGAVEFLPAFDEGAQAMTFLNRAAVAALRVDRALALDALETLALPTEHEVEVQLAGGERLAGVVSYVRPEEHARLLDFLNEPAPFFPLLEAGAVALVNKRHVARVVIVRS